VIDKELQGRLWRLCPAAVALARAVAALGERAMPEVAHALAGLEAEVAEKAHAALAHAGLLERDALRFIHPRMANATLAGLVPETRSRLHRRAAALLLEAGAEDDAAAQILAAEPAGDAHAATLLLRTGRRALEAGDRVRATRHLRRALHESQFAPAPELLRLLQRVDGVEVGVARAV
jgi:hypothetical protein